MARLEKLVRVRHMRDIDCEVLRSSFQAMHLGQDDTQRGSPAFLHGAIPVRDSTPRGLLNLVPGRRPARPLEHPVLFPGAGFCDSRYDFATVGRRCTTHLCLPCPASPTVAEYALLRVNGRYHSGSWRKGAPDISSNPGQAAAGRFGPAQHAQRPMKCEPGATKHARIFYSTDNDA